MDSKKVLEMAKTLLKAINENPEGLEETLNKGYVKKDDKPHLPNTPEDKAHDVAEDGEKLPEALEQVKGDKSKMLSHLRTLTDDSKKRSPENKKAGETKKGWQKTEATALMLSEKWEPKYMKKCGEMKKEEALDKGKMIAGPGHPAHKPGTVMSDTGEPERTEATPRRAVQFGDKLMPSRLGSERIKLQESAKKGLENKKAKVSEKKEDKKAAEKKKVKKTEEKEEVEKRCWDGYEPTPGKKPYEKGSCKPVKKTSDDKESE